MADIIDFPGPQFAQPVSADRGVILELEHEIADLRDVIADQALELRRLSPPPARPDDAPLKITWAQPIPARPASSSRPVIVGVLGLSTEGNGVTLR